MLLETSRTLLEEGLTAPDESKQENCFHCGTPCGRGRAYQKEEKAFCCQGCLTVFELLTENGLTDFYRLNKTPGVRINPGGAEQFKFLDEPAVRERLVDFADERITRVTLHLPSIHCIACVWLLENLFKFKEGIGSSKVNFPRKEVSITFATGTVRLSELAALLSSLGYPPAFNFADLDVKGKDPALRKLYLQLGVAGFAFGNNMLFSIALYFGVDSFSGPAFQRMVGFLSMALVIPVVLFSAQSYWRLAWNGLKHKVLTIEVPIAAGIIAIFTQSAYEVISGRGEGYFDSLAGLIFFLLCGRLFQQKTYARLSFDRDYKSFFPLSITRKANGDAESVSLSQLKVGDTLLIRNAELIPADAELTTGPALIDYSFVTGESEPVEKKPGDYLYAGGRQIGSAIEVKSTKAVSQSYLTSLWNQEAFRKGTKESLDTLINRYSVRFTLIVMAIAVGAAAFWLAVDPSKALRSFIAVLIVACPCALALAAPFTLGTALRVLGRRNIFVKSTDVIETFARINAVVFDKTGTLTAAGAESIQFEGAPLAPAESDWIFSLTRHSTHPYSVRIGDSFRAEDQPVRSFQETAGCGMEGIIHGHEIWMGSAAWLRSRNIPVAGHAESIGSVVHVAIDRKYRGCFVLVSSLRPRAESLIQELGRNHELALLSGDNEKERERFSTVFGSSAPLYFNQNPLEKLEFIRRLQTSGKSVMMVGDGLNDAGALKQSDAGIAVVENIGSFSPASDVIMSARMIPHLADLLKFSRGAVTVVRLSFGLSAVYNVVGIAIAASGFLSPIVCAVLMPLSSISVIAFACGATEWLGRRNGFKPQSSSPITTNRTTIAVAPLTLREAGI